MDGTHPTPNDTTESAEVSPDLTAELAPAKSTEPETSPTREQDDAGFMAAKVVSFIGRVSQGAEKSIRHIRWLFAVCGAVAVFTLYYFIGVRGWHWVWATMPIMLMVLPVIVLLIGERMLSAVAGLPAKAVGMGHAIAEASREHWPKIREFEARDLKGLVKWRSYVLLAKVLWQARSVKADGTSLFAGLRMIALVCNPVFWGLMLGAIVLLMIECGVMLLLCVGFMLLG